MSVNKSENLRSNMLLVKKKHEISFSYSQHVKLQLI